MITSMENKQVKNLSALLKKSRERKKQGVFVAEGTRMVQETPEGLLQTVYVSQAYEDNPQFAPLRERFRVMAPEVGYEVLSDPVFKSVSDTQTPQGILAVVRQPSYGFKDLLCGSGTMLLVLEGIQDPGNLGTMLRTGEGAGITGVIMDKTTVDLFNPKTIRSTMGSIYRVPYYITDGLAQAVQELKEKGVMLYAAHLGGTAVYDEFDYTKRCAFLVGNEGNGLSDGIAQLADAYVKIPMAGQVESLNAAISAALFMYEANRQRRRK